MLARHTGLSNFEDYRFKDGEFGAMKAAGAFTFDQVPALEISYPDGRKEQLSQTVSILRYIAKVTQASAYPSDPIQAAYVDSICDQEADIFSSVVAVKYKERFGFGSLDDAAIAKVRKDLQDEVLPRHLAFLEGLLAKSTSGWLASTADASIADFLLAPRLEWLASGGAGDGISVDILQQYPRVLSFIEKFNALPAVAQYRSEQQKA